VRAYPSGYARLEALRLDILNGQLRIPESGGRPPYAGNNRVTKPTRNGSKCPVFLDSQLLMKPLENMGSGST
jgi:hypothetical protein